MWSFQLKPVSFLHVAKSCNLIVYHVVDIMLSSSVVERHVFSNSRKCASYVGHLSKVFSYYHPYSSCISYEKYTIFAEELTDEFLFNC